VSFSIPAHAQKPVYRCETAGKVSYSDAPCVGAKEIDATPTQGMDKMTGASRNPSLDNWLRRSNPKWPVRLKVPRGTDPGSPSAKTRKPVVS
jgi:hypothetical protein